MKLILLLLSMVALSVGQITAQETPPTLNVVDQLSPDGPTFTVTAGSEAMPRGFSILITNAEGGLLNVDKIAPANGDDCDGYNLEPGETSPEFQILANPTLNVDECQLLRTANILACGDFFGYTVHVRHSKTRAVPVIIQLPCD